MISEKRKNPRFVCYRPKSFPIDFEGCQEEGYLADVSRGGVGFRVKRSFPIGSICKLRIKPADIQTPVPGVAKVQWTQYENQTKEFLCGAQILTMDPALKTDLIDTLYRDWKNKTVPKP